jgi:cytochrome c oxidase cbb3-type subunit I
MSLGLRALEMSSGNSFTDWGIGHVHSGAIGWVAMMTIGSLYVLIPRLYGQKAMWRP